MEAGVTIPLVQGYDMVSREFPSYGKPLQDQIKTGVRDSKWLDKSLIFNPKTADINYLTRCHEAGRRGVLLKSFVPRPL